jgi:hypothetical protein
MKTKLIAPLFLLAIFAQGCIIVDDDGGNAITVYNDSDYIIEDLYITEVDTFDWGPDLLGSAGLFPDESISIDVFCDVYDVKLVDEFGVECEIYDIDVCFGEEAAFSVTNSLLDDCAFGVNATESKSKRVHGHGTEAAAESSSESPAVTL